MHKTPVIREIYAIPKLSAKSSAACPLGNEVWALRHSSCIFKLIPSGIWKLIAWLQIGLERYSKISWVSRRKKKIIPTKIQPMIVATTTFLLLCPWSLFLNQAHHKSAMMGTIDSNELLATRLITPFKINERSANWLKKETIYKSKMFIEDHLDFSAGSLCGNYFSPIILWTITTAIFDSFHIIDVTKASIGYFYMASTAENRSKKYFDESLWYRTFRDRNSHFANFLFYDRLKSIIIQ